MTKDVGSANFTQNKNNLIVGYLETIHRTERTAFISKHGPQKIK